jgi:hypothetical protein
VANLQLEWSEAELLATDAIEAPLVAGGIRCHGGFDAEGRYVSPRTKYRSPAIVNWQQHHTATFGAEILDVPLRTWPENYPNVKQAQYLLDEGVRDPIVALLTRVGTVEGFGGFIRHSAVPNIQRHFDEEVRGTALAHLDRGLFEAHARDEAGHEDEGGHNLMWFAARDVAFENPVTEDQTQIMLQRMAANGGGPMERPRTFPDIDGDLEAAFQFMARLLLIEISAFHVFAWAEEMLSDPQRVAGDGAAGRLVSYIRQDETPHVEYLKTVLTEMRDRTFVGASGRKHKGSDVIGRVWNTAIEESLGVRRDQNIKLTVREVEHALDGNPRATDILEQFHQLGTVRP